MLLKEYPYNLFRTLEQIKILISRDFNLAAEMFEQIVTPLNRRKTNVELFQIYKNNQHYTKYASTHMINNFYKDEETRLQIGNTYMLLKSTEAKPDFLFDINRNENYFVCDFQNQDYFWIEQLRARVA